MPGYFVHALGCRASAADGDAAAAALERAGFAPASQENADLLLLQTCAVTAEAEATARAWIRRARRRNPKSRLIVSGCYAQRAPGELAGLAGVNAVIGNSHASTIADAARSLPMLLPAEALVRHRPFSAVDDAPFAGEHTLLPPGTRRTRPVLKVQDGCGNRCAFCVIPETRGPSRSVSLAAACTAAKAFADAGGQELVVSGINLGRWGRDLRPAQSLPELLHALLATGVPRIRVSSVEPMDWTPELLAVFAEHAAGGNPRLAPHAHLPLQSGADATLRAMHRRYRPWHYAEKLRTLRAMLPDAALGADVMVGFPGETEALFRESLEFVEAMPLTYLHLFPFSPRPGTRAYNLPRVPSGAVRERMAEMAALAGRKQQGFESGFVGRELSAVTLRDGTALSANYLSIRLQTPAPPNRLVRVRPASYCEEQLHALAAGGTV